MYSQGFFTDAEINIDSNRWINKTVRYIYIYIYIYIYGVYQFIVGIKYI